MSEQLFTPSSDLSLTRYGSTRIEQRNDGPHCAGVEPEVPCLESNETVCRNLDLVRVDVRSRNLPLYLSRRPQETVCQGGAVVGFELRLGRSLELVYSPTAGTGVARCIRGGREEQCLSVIRHRNG